MGGEGLWDGTALSGVEDLASDGGGVVIGLVGEVTRILGVVTFDPLVAAGDFEVLCDGGGGEFGSM